MAHKTMIAPIVAVIAIAAQLIFGVEIEKELQDEIVAVIANVIAVSAVVYGIVKNHKKDGEK